MTGWQVLREPSGAATVCYRGLMPRSSTLAPFDGEAMPSGTDRYWRLTGALHSEQSRRLALDGIALREERSVEAGTPWTPAVDLEVGEATTRAWYGAERFVPAREVRAIAPGEGRGRRGRGERGGVHAAALPSLRLPNGLPRGTGRTAGPWSGARSGPGGAPCADRAGWCTARLEERRAGTPGTRREQAGETACSREERSGEGCQPRTARTAARRGWPLTSRTRDNTERRLQSSPAAA